MPRTKFPSPLYGRRGAAGEQDETIWVGGARTYRESVGTVEVLVGLQASQSMLGLHTILSARPPVEQYSLGALNSSHQITIGSPCVRVKRQFTVQEVQ